MFSKTQHNQDSIQQQLPYWCLLCRFYFAWKSTKLEGGQDGWEPVVEGRGGGVDGRNGGLGGRGDLLEGRGGMAPVGGDGWMGLRRK
jgi:hypothetical protein